MSVPNGSEPTCSSVLDGVVHDGTMSTARQELGGRPFGDGTAPGPVRAQERVDPARTPLR